ncbi:ParB N-terminal domain-containing protein [Delftia sp. PE138]|uniref:ParB/RepB/Spo0J family partition protein n=1 Tax=Delftia sp. PE138 TaxID=1812483 RepID=UPI001BAE752C|nr:ParB N-terminal domain-containing protein [Delftia sp. PE138]MBS3719405.1 hypothetical protein [Delftia sp. PE138]
MTNSVRKMLESKEAKRADAVHVRYESLHVEPGFNLRQQDDELEASIEALALHIIDGGKYPPLEVRPRDDGGMWIVDGHRRHAAIGRALARNAPLRSPKDGEAWIHVVLFEGNEEDRIARIITSAANKPLTPAEIAEGYKRLKAFGWTPAQIAKKVGRSAQHVQDLLALGNAPSPVREMVKAGQVSATRAAKAARKHGDKATAVLGEQLQQAQAKGKKRITAATAEARKPAPVDADGERYRWLFGARTAEELEAMTADSGPPLDKPQDVVMCELMTNYISKAYADEMIDAARAAQAAIKSGDAP